MMLKNTSRFATWAAVSVCVFAAMRIAPLSAQGTTSDSVTLRALLVEVRQLRIAVENATSITPRIQVANQRVERLEQTVADLKQKLSQARGYSRAMQSSESPLYGDADQQARAAAREAELADSLSATQAELADTKKILDTLLAPPSATGQMR